VTAEKLSVGMDSTHLVFFVDAMSVSLCSLKEIVEMEVEERRGRNCGPGTYFNV
jgi:hypothetical protein